MANSRSYGSIRHYCGSRAILSCWTKTFLLFFLLAFFWIQLTLNNNFRKRVVGKSNKLQVPVTEETLNVKNQQGQLHNNETRTTDGQIEKLSKLRNKVVQINREQMIFTEDIYGPLTNDSLVIVIQVHTRVIYLRYLIESLSKAQYINEVLLIFSHDVFDEDINKLIQSIKFCKVMQIFFPYSIELNPDKFPGNDPRDCPRDIGKQRARKTKCLNADHPDKYGNYRESKYTQIKHHWWWKANYVFNKLKITQDYDGLVTFLEEDHYVAEDFIYMLKSLNHKCAQIPDCYFLGLGFHINLNSYKEISNIDKGEISPLTTNLGLSFNRATFKKVLGCSQQFCVYDDYNWDWSLNFVAQSCNGTPLRSLICKGPRVFHTGECGTHIQKGNCAESVFVSKIQKLLDNAKGSLFPSNVSVYDPGVRKKSLIENGGWGDIRDHELCINMTKL